jgi:hypothetical protein
MRGVLANGKATTTATAGGVTAVDGATVVVGATTATGGATVVVGATTATGGATVVVGATTATGGATVVVLVVVVEVVVVAGPPLDESPQKTLTSPTGAIVDNPPPKLTVSGPWKKPDTNILPSLLVPTP